jgi:hypothetical protein
MRAALYREANAFLLGEDHAPAPHLRVGEITNSVAAVPL